MDEAILLYADEHAPACEVVTAIEAVPLDIMENGDSIFRERFPDCLDHHVRDDPGEVEGVLLDQLVRVLHLHFRQRKHLPVTTPTERMFLADGKGIAPFFTERNGVVADSYSDCLVAIGRVLALTIDPFARTLHVLFYSMYLKKLLHVSLGNEVRNVITVGRHNGTRLMTEAHSMTHLVSRSDTCAFSPVSYVWIEVVC